MERHLHLVASLNNSCDTKFDLFKCIFDYLSNIKTLFVSRNEKIYIIKDILIDIYRDYEITTGISDEPYFVRADKKIRRIIREKKVDYYFNLLMKNQKY